MTIIDQYGNPIDRGVLREPQTSRIATLQNQYLTPMLAGLTPAKLAGYLRRADDGDLTAQHRLFADMEERDAHIACEMGKRSLAVMRLDWDILPPRDATAKEKADAEWLKEVLTDAQDPFEDLLLALMGGVGHGFAPVELDWRREGADWLPGFHPRPQEWFRLDRDRRELRLLDASAEGAPLTPFGWVLHTHGKPKTGYLGRAGLHRTLSWPFLYKAYALGDFAEFIETYGLPMIVGKYYNGASADEKASLMRAVTALGHDARAIMPVDMQLEIQKITGGGDSTPHLAMMAWADGAISKAVLGQVLSAEAKATGLGSGVANLQADVRDDIRDADAMQIAGTVTRDVLYPLLALNRGIESLSRCPRLVFDTGEAEDMAAYAENLPKLVSLGMRIPAEWAHERLRIPQANGEEAVLGVAAATDGTGEPARDAMANRAEIPGSPKAAKGKVSPGGTAADVAKDANALRAALAALAAQAGAADAGTDPTPIDAQAEQLAREAGPALAAILDHVRELLARAGSLTEFGDALLAAYGGLPGDTLAEVMALGYAAADLAGRFDASQT